MTGITQKIPNYIGGISQQPDELMPPGSVRDALNVLPDVTNGLTKRAGTRLINPLVTNEDGKWFHIDRDRDEKYLGKINDNGTVEIWDINNQALPVEVNYRALPPGVQEEEKPPETGYPNCSWERVTEALFNMSEANQRMGEAQGKLDGLIYQKENLETSVTDKQVFYKTGKHPNGYPGITVIEGYIGKEPVGPIPSEKNTTYKRGKQKKSNKTVWVPNPNYTDDPNQRRDEYIVKNNKDVYEMVWERDITVADPNDFDDEIKEARREYEARRERYKELRDIYVNELAKCGKEYGDFNRQLDSPEEGVVPEYLKTGSGEAPLEVLTVNDYTFITNPNIPVTASKSDAEKRDPEAFVQVTAMQYSREYTLDIKEEGSNPTSYRRATGISLQSSESFSGSDSSCPFNGNHTFTVEDPVTGANNLVFELNVVGTSYQTEHPATKPDHYECRYRAYVTLKFGGQGWRKGDTVTVELSGREHTIVIDKVEKIQSYGNIDIHPDVTTVDGDAILSQQEVLSNIKKAIDDDPRAIGYDVEIIGGGVYITNSTINFTVSTPEATLMKVITDEANDISYLPVECKDGYIVKIANTDSEEDDYWVKFETDERGVDGAGSWVECRKPGIFAKFNMTTMPHQIIRQEDGSFLVCPVEWEERLVGDDKTNPLPSFCSRAVGYPKIYEYAEDDPDTIDIDEEEKKNDFRYIQKMVFFRNRLTMISGENVICSKPGDYFNFFGSTALTVTDNDPIDVAASSTQPVVLKDAIETTAGLLCFGPTQQHLLSTDSELFSPRTARFNMVSTYRYSGVPVFSLGTTVGFTQKAGLVSRVMELTNVSRQEESNANELSKPVSTLIPNDVNLITNSNDNNLLAVSKTDSKDVWLYRYFQNDKDRIQSAWFRWELSGYNVYHAIMEDTMFIVSYNYSDSPNTGKIISLMMLDLKDTLSTSLVSTTYDDNEVVYEAHLDNYRVAFPSDAQYYQHIDQTYFLAPLIYYNDETLVAYALSPNQVQDDAGAKFTLVGSAIEVKVEVDNYGTWFVLDGNWSATRLMIGYAYDMSVELPTFYPLKAEQAGGQVVSRSDTRSDLRLHRAKINFGHSGVYDTTLIRKGREDYSQMYESTPADSYVANEVAFLEDQTQTVPIYAKNTDVKLCIKSSHPSPATIYSVEWEGNYTRKGYRSV
jgi:hypothetical protein